MLCFLAVNAPTEVYKTEGHVLHQIQLCLISALFITHSPFWVISMLPLILKTYCEVCVGPHSTGTINKVFNPELCQKIEK